LHFKTYIPAELPPVKANGGALREVLGNLLDNAVKYTPQGKVEMAVRVLPETVAIAIKDSGYGIPVSDMEHLFERRFRGRQALR
jgi:signal transduction histidine kinase